MTIDLDRTLSRLGDVRDHPALDTIDIAVTVRIRADVAARGTGMSMACIAAIGAVMLGMFAADPWAGPAMASPLSGDLALAPSTLLAGR